MCVGMATKNISITESAYKLLVMKKMREKESFSEVITREFGSQVKLMALYGILSGKKGEQFKSNIEKAREIHQIAEKGRVKRLKEMFE